MDWYFAFLLVCFACHYKAWKAKSYRDTCRWFSFAHAFLATYAACSFVHIWISNPWPLQLLALLMLLMALLAGSVASVYCLRWLHIPRARQLRVISLRCVTCEETLPNEPHELLNHLRLFHPDVYDDVIEGSRE